MAGTGCFELGQQGRKEDLERQRQVRSSTAKYVVFHVTPTQLDALGVVVSAVASHTTSSPAASRSVLVHGMHAANNLLQDSYFN